MSNHDKEAKAVFNLEKLDWTNSQYIKKIDDEQLVRLLDLGENRTIIPLIRDRLKKLDESSASAAYPLRSSSYGRGAPAFHPPSQAVGDSGEGA